MRDPLRGLQWEDGELWILDQRMLPGRVKWIRARRGETVARAIESLAIRGAPAIGIAAAYAVALEARRRPATPATLQRMMVRLATTRPTAYNLFHALDEVAALVARGGSGLAMRIERAARRFHADDARACRAMGRHGLKLLRSPEHVLTYCHSGALATGGIGTALGVIRLGYRRGKIEHVYACETRPMAQGARLTVWECARFGIPVTLICDNMAASLMAAGRVTRVLVGADRIARNGDVANKIGTLNLAQLARAYRIPFHVVAPLSTFDPKLKSGRGMPIEERDPSEVTRLVAGLEQVKGLRVWNPAFDVTPARLVTSYVTELGIGHPPFKKLIAT